MNNNEKLLATLKNIKQLTSLDCIYAENGDTLFVIDDAIIEAENDIEHTIQIEWSTDDISQRALEYDVDLSVTKCKDVLSILKKSHDCNFGITWDHVDDAINQVRG